MRVLDAKTIRFAKIVEQCGKPKVVSLWTDPKKDRNLMAAVRANRVMTVEQENTGSSRDFGLVGFHPKRNASYLEFRKPLDKFKGHPVIGIKYDLVEEAVPLSSGIGLRFPGADRKRRKERKDFAREEQTSSGELTTKQFRVRIRHTATIETEIEITAASKKLARNIALEKAEPLDFTKGEVTHKLVGITEIKKRGRSLA